jgi:hypothetical protein
MDASSRELRAGRLMLEALKDLLRPPFSVLTGLTLLVYLVSDAVSRPGDDASALLGIALAVVATYAHIACTLAAATPEPGRSGDAWLVAALRRRCFLRYVGTELVTLLLVAVSLLAFVIGAFVVGGIVALAHSAAALERRGPLEAIKRSALLGRDVRRTLAVVFGMLVLVPGIAVQAAYQLGASRSLGVWWLALGVPAAALNLAGTIALARAFVALGGAPAPPSEQALPAAPA